MSRAFWSWLALLALCSCTIDDEDRCPDGYEYNPKAQACCEEGWHYDPAVENCVEPEGSDTSTGDTDTDADTDTDGDAGADGDGDTDTDTDEGTDDGLPSGLGETCTGDEQCADFEADFCAISPLASEGYCTVTDCEPGECPQGYSCCDCSASTILEGIACLTEEEAAMAQKLADCTCE